MQTDKHYEDFKKLLEKNPKGKKYTEEEIKSSYLNFQSFCHLLYDMAIEQIKKDRKLEKFPKGFHLEKGLYSCKLCGRTISGEESWYDKNGTKCVDCQRNVDKKVIPQYVLKDDKSWVQDWEIKSKYGIHPATREKLIREGKIKPRRLIDSNGVEYFRLFILKENEYLSGIPVKEFPYRVTISGL